MTIGQKAVCRCQQNLQLINFFTSIPLYPGWLFPFFFGLFFITITKHPKLEKAIIIIIFFIPTLYAFVGFILMIMLFDPSTGAHPGGIAYTP
jgi:hypothetical protein